MEVRRPVEVIQKEIEARFAELAELSPADLAEGEVLDYVQRSERIRTMADAQCARAAGALESSQAWVADGARSPSAWTAWRCRIPKRRAAASGATARRLRNMPLAEAAFLAGRITSDHVRVLAAAQETAPGPFAEGGEAVLLESAEGLRFPQFETAVRYWRHLAAPDAVEDEATRRWLDRQLHCSRSFEGVGVIDGTLDPMTAEVVFRELERLERELFAGDLAEARARLGVANPPLAELRRTPAQRRADALRVMAERSAAKPPGAVEPRVLVQVLAGHESVERMCELSSGHVVTPGEVLPVLDKADVERVVFDGPSKVIDIGVRQRLFRGATRQAVQLRDRQCVHESCDVPAELCEVDHIVPYGQGGLTIQDNGRCKCKYHHRRGPPPV